MGPVHIRVGEPVRVAKAQINMRLGRKVENGVNVVPLEAAQDLGRVGDVALVEGKVSSVVEDSGVVE